MLNLIFTTGKTKEEIAVPLELLCPNADEVAMQPLLTSTCTKQRFRLYPLLMTVDWH